MGLTIGIRDEDGTLHVEVGEIHSNLLGLVSQDDQSFPLLRYVDPYGDTTFNPMQAGALVEELERLLDRAKNEFD